MGFLRKMKLSKVKKRAELNHIYLSSSSYNCTVCVQSEKAKCVTGLKCTLRAFENGDFLIIPQDYICDSFEYVDFYWSEKV